MSVLFIGMIQPHEVSEIFPRRGPVVDPACVRVFAPKPRHASVVGIIFGH